MSGYEKEFMAFVSALASAFVAGLWRKLQMLEKKIDEVNRDIHARIDQKESAFNKSISHLQENKVSRDELKILIDTIHQDLRDIKTLLSKAIGGKNG